MQVVSLWVAARYWGQTFDLCSAARVSVGAVPLLRLRKQGDKSLELGTLTFLLLLPAPLQKHPKTICITGKAVKTIFG